jgi:heat shock protein HslJ
MRLILTALSALALTACNQDETVRAYGAGDRLWTVAQLNDQAFTAQATLSFPKTGQMVGDAPCNSYATTMSVPYPWFTVGPITATKRACPDLAAETAFFNALKAAEFTEVHGNTMLISNENGVLLLLKADG